MPIKYVLNKKIALIILVAITFVGCISQQQYSKSISPLYAFENFEKAVSNNDDTFAWNCLSSGLQERQFSNSIQSFKNWIDAKGPELQELLAGEYVSELIVEQNKEMLLLLSNGSIRFVKENSEWKIDSLLLKKE